MTIKTRMVIHDLYGKPFRRPAEEGQLGPELTVGDAIADALQFTYPDEQSLAGSEKIKRTILAEAFILEDEVTLSNQEAAEIEKVIEKYWGAVVYTRLMRLLERPDEAEEGNRQERRASAKRRGAKA